MLSQTCPMLYEPYDPVSETRIALRQSAHVKAVGLAQSGRHGSARIGYRLWLIEVLEACKPFGEHFWRDVLIGVRETMEREAKS